MVFFLMYSLKVVECYHSTVIKIDSYIRCGSVQVHFLEVIDDANESEYLLTCMPLEIVEVTRGYQRKGYTQKVLFVTYYNFIFYIVKELCDTAPPPRKY